MASVLIVLWFYTSVLRPTGWEPPILAALKCGVHGAVSGADWCQQGISGHRLHLLWFCGLHGNTVNICVTWRGIVVWWTVDWEGFGKEWSWPIWGITPGCVWRNWEKPWKTSVRMASGPADNRSKNLPNRIERYRYNNLLVSIVCSLLVFDIRVAARIERLCLLLLLFLLLPLGA
jgi:hypothetical protein